MKCFEGEKKWNDLLWMPGGGRELNIIFFYYSYKKPHSICFPVVTDKYQRCASSLEARRRRRGRKACDGQRCPWVYWLMKQHTNMTIYSHRGRGQRIWRGHVYVWVPSVKSMKSGDGWKSSQGGRPAWILFGGRCDRLCSFIQQGAEWISHLRSFIQWSEERSGGHPHLFCWLSLITGTFAFVRCL